MCVRACVCLMMAATLVATALFFPLETLLGTMTHSRGIRKDTQGTYEVPWSELGTWGRVGKTGRGGPPAQS